MDEELMQKLKNENNKDSSSLIWPLIVALLSMPKNSINDIEIAELKGRLDTLEKVVFSK